MTYQAFLAKLPKLGPWRLCRTREIVQVKHTGNCPWLAVSQRYPSAEPQGFEQRDIFKAADGVLGHDRKIRADLLKACRLKVRHGGVR